MIPLHDNFPFFSPFFYQMHYDVYHHPWYKSEYSPLTIHEKQVETVICDKNVEIFNESKALNSSQTLQHQESIEKTTKAKAFHSKIKSHSVYSVCHNKKKRANPSSEIQVPTIKNQTQKEGRNANSNLLRMFFRRISQRMEAEPELMNYIIKRNKLKIKIQAFREWLELNQVDHRNYVRLPDVRDIFVAGKNNREQAKIMRILLKDFLQNEALCYYLTSKKVKKQAMPHNFNAMKNILKAIFQLPKTH